MHRIVRCSITAILVISAIPRICFAADKNVTKRTGAQLVQTSAWILQNGVKESTDSTVSQNDSLSAAHIPTDPAQWHPIPWSSFDTPSHQVQCELLLNDSRFRLVVDEDWIIEFHPRVMPLKLVELSTGHLCAILRRSFDGSIGVVLLDDDHEHVDITVPSRLQRRYFRQAAVFNGHLFLVMYNPVTKRNVLHRMLSTPKGRLAFDEDFSFELFFGGRYEIGSSVYMAGCGEELYVCGERTRFRYDERNGQPTMNRYEFPAGLVFRELVSNGREVAGLVQDVDAKVKQGSHGFHVYDVRLANRIAHLSDGAPPYRLRFEDDQLVVSRLETVDDLLDVVARDLATMERSGLMNMGENNAEARVAWSQVYYLQAFIDLVSERVGLSATSRLDRLKRPARLRLDQEMWLLDRLYDDGQPGIKCRRYAMGRRQGIYAVQSGRLLKVFKRYTSECLPGVHIENFAKVRSQCEQLTGHAEILNRAPARDKWLPQGTYFLAWPRGVPLQYDGINLPYNHQHEWASGIAWGESVNSQSRECLAARDMIATFVDGIGLSKAPPADFEWAYAWGLAREGWTEADGISDHCPSYGGDLNMAHISYRTIDASAVLTVGTVYPESLSREMIEYFSRAIEADKLYLFLASDLKCHNVNPQVSRELALKYIRASAPWEIPNALWAARFLEQTFASSEKTAAPVRVSEISSEKTATPVRASETSSEKAEKAETPVGVSKPSNRRVNRTMSRVTLAMIGSFLATVLVVAVYVFFVRDQLNVRLRILTSVLCLPVAAFSVFGFFASFEAGVIFGWKIGFLAIFTATVTSGITPWIWRSLPTDHSPQA